MSYLLNQASKLARKTASSDVISTPTGLQIANSELPSEKQLGEKASCAAGFIYFWSALHPILSSYKYVSPSQKKNF